MKVFITGSEGFVGTHLKARLLKEGHSVVGLDNLSHPCKFRDGDFINADIKDIWKYSEFIKDCDWIVNLAAQINVEKSILDPLETCNSNFMGTLAVLETAKKLNKKVIHASTTEIYGDRLTKKMNEIHPMNPKSPYAASKLGADGLCHAYFHSYETKVIIVRNFNTYGIYQSNDKWGAVIAKFAERLKDSKPPLIYGDGTQKRDFMYYTDAIDFYMLCLKGKAKFGEEYNIGYGESISIKNLAELMIKISKILIVPKYTKPRPGEVKDFVCDNTKARKLGWEPKVNFADGLKTYMEWKENA